MYLVPDHLKSVVDNPLELADRPEKVVRVHSGTWWGHVQGIHCGSVGQELWSEGHSCLSGRQPLNLLMDTKGEGGHQAGEGGFPGLVGWCICGSSRQVLFVWEGCNQGCQGSRTLREKDFQLASNKFWQTVRWLHNGNRRCWLLTWTGDIVGRSKEHFEEFLSLVNTSSWQEAGFEDLGEDLFISVGEVIEISQSQKAAQWQGDRGGGDSPQDAVRLWALWDCLRWHSFAVSHSACRAVDWGGCSRFLKGDRRVCCNYRGITLLSVCCTQQCRELH